MVITRWDRYINQSQWWLYTTANSQKLNRQVSKQGSRLTDTRFLTAGGRDPKETF